MMLVHIKIPTRWELLFVLLAMLSSVGSASGVDEKNHPQEPIVGGNTRVQSVLGTMLLVNPESVTTMKIENQEKAMPTKNVKLVSKKTIRRLFKKQTEDHNQIVSKHEATILALQRKLERIENPAESFFAQLRKKFEEANPTVRNEASTTLDEKESTNLVPFLKKDDTVTLVRKTKFRGKIKKYRGKIHSFKIKKNFDLVYTVKITHKIPESVIALPKEVTGTKFKDARLWNGEIGIKKYDDPNEERTTKPTDNKEVIVGCETSILNRVPSMFIKKTEVNKMKADIETSKATITNQEATIETKNKEIVKLKETEKQTINQLKTAKKQLEESKEQLEVSKKQASQFKQTLGETRHKLRQSDMEKTATLETLENTSQHMVNIESTFNRLSNSVKTLTKEKKDLNTENKRLQQESNTFGKKALIAAFKRYPQLNRRLDDNQYVFKGNKIGKVMNVFVKDIKIEQEIEWKELADKRKVNFSLKDDEYGNLMKRFLADAKLNLEKESETKTLSAEKQWTIQLVPPTLIDQWDNKCAAPINNYPKESSKNEKNSLTSE